MSCCPSAPTVTPSSSISVPNGGQESDIQPGESVPCYAARAGDQTGKMDDATANPENKIENTAIPIKVSDASVNVTFKLTSASTRTPTTWTISPSVPNITFTSNGDTATFVGTFAPDQYGQKFSVLVTASDGTEIDARTFNFSPTKSDGSDSIRLIFPLPGGIVNSKFGPRVHPISGTMKLHTGIDCKMVDRSTVDVVAAADGVVVAAGVNGTLTSGYGNCVKIQHKNGAGTILCTTVYAHMSAIYCAVGQTVAAGQKIGHEGSTGSSTGNHLHFEVRLTDSPTSVVDPVPYIQGGASVADQTTPTGDPATPPTPTGDAGAAVNAPNNAATAAPCPANGVNPDPNTNPSGSVTPPPADAPPPVSGDPFEHAWYFTMTFEVGSSWTAASPSDPDVSGGLIDTPAQQKKVGYKAGPNFPGGETKFGVAQNPNKSKIVVKTVTYPQAKTFGRSNYWSIGGSTNCDALPPLVGILLFDMNYLHGPGYAQRFLADSGASGISPSASQADQLAACSAITGSALSFISTLNPKYQAGWVNRTNARLKYVQSLPYPIT